MTSNERRQQLLEFLKEQGQQPVSASVMAAKFGVSRQIIVGDVALLRASGADISATPRGYIFQDASASGSLLRTIACRHDDASLREELYTIVDFGGGVMDVSVEHPVYGQICGQLHIFSRYDADQFCAKLETCMAPPLASLTSGVHLHTISCPNEQVLERILENLEKKGFLLQKND